jgi:uncharacterized protein (DUF433 family)
LYTHIVRGAEFGTVGHNDTPREEPQTDATKMIVSRDPEIMSGELVFTGTCVEIKTLVDYLEGGHTLDDFSSVHDHRP